MSTIHASGSAVRRPPAGAVVASAGAGRPARQKRFGSWPVVLGTVLAVAAVGYFLTKPQAPSAATAGGSSVMEVGRPVPDFTAADLDGAPVSLRDLRGRPVWLVFNATWCAGCRAEAPDLQATYNEMKDAGLVVLSVYKAESPLEVRPYASLLGLSFINIPDPDSRLSSQYRVSGVPEHYFIDRNGVLVAVRPGGLNHEQMRTAGRDLLAR